MKLYVLYGGDIICRNVSMLNGGSSEKEVIDLANPVFLIKHPQGTLLWDSGLPDSYVGLKEGVEAWIFHLSLKKTLISQLEEISVKPADIDYFAFSHIHNDHTGNASLFKASKIVMQEKEFNIAFDQNNRPYNYEDIRALENSEFIKLKGDYDLFGDGSVTFISTPGHTPGHQSLLVKLPETGYVIVSGDISYYQENYKNRGVPTFNSSKEETLASLEKIEHLSRELNARLWIQHDKDQYHRLKHSPEFYD
jgi:glyoxylase-like metal-dependent hydrolase (beta-lactamase superfamily II)